MTESENPSAPDSLSGSLVNPVSASAVLARDIQQFQRRGPAGLTDRIAVLTELEKRAIDLAAVSEDGHVKTLSAGSVLAVLDHWERLCRRLGGDESADKCHVVVRSAVEEAAAAWDRTRVQSSDSPGIEDLFRCQLQSIQLQLDINRRIGHSKNTEQQLGEARDWLRKEILQRVAEQVPGDRQLDVWSRFVADHCDSVVTSIDDLAPDAAIRQINTVSESARWYLAEIDSRRCLETRRIKRKLARLRAERQERQVLARMEAKFGRRFAGFIERLVLVLILLVLALMVIEWTTHLSPQTQYWFDIVDGAACVIFLLEFFTKLSLVEGRWTWFQRHLFVDLIPSIPIGLLTAGLAGSGDIVRAGRVTRFLRLPRLVRYVRILRPLIRIFRALGLMARGIDRVVRQFGRTLNCNVILYPNQAELEHYERRRPEPDAEHSRLWRRVRDEWGRLLAAAGDQERRVIAPARIEVLRSAVSVKSIHFEQGAGPGAGVRDIPAEALLDNFESLDPESAEATLGESIVAQLGRIVKALSIGPIRMLPIIRQCIPKGSRGMTNSQAVAKSSRMTAAFLRRFHDLWFWFADLYGTVTPSQFVDRVGGMLVRSSSRPAYRLVMFGGILLMMEGVLTVIQFEALSTFRETIASYVGTTVMILGSVCFLVLGLGIWLQRVAKESTDFYRRSVQAQFLALTDSIRAGHLTRDARILYERVLKTDWPESDTRTDDEKVADVVARLQRSIIRTPETDDSLAKHPFLDRLMLLYRDWLDGGLFTDSDTRTTNQLLGNTALRQLLLVSHRVSRKDLKRLRVLDLEQQKSLLTGPYLWFSFVSQSIAHSVAYLLVNYNRKAIPMSEREYSTKEVRQAFHGWLSLSDTMDIRQKRVSIDESQYVTTSFTAMHFLDDDPVRDRTVEEQFGSEVYQRLKHDRCLLIRRVFGSLPMHEQPRSQRVVNLYSVYENWIAHGRVFLIPWFFFVLSLMGFLRLVGWIYRAVQEIRNPEIRAARRDATHADFRVAVRKISRIRGPVAKTCGRLRAMFDPAWLGTPLPGETDTLLRGADIRADLPFLDAGPHIERSLQKERRRSEESMWRLEKAMEDGLLTRLARQRNLDDQAFDSRQHLRAAAIAIHGDLNRVRSKLFARALLSETYQTTQAEPAWLDLFNWRQGLRRIFNRYWQTHGSNDRAARRAAWRATLQNENGVADALCAWGEFGDDVERAGELSLGELLVHPGRITEQLLTLRMVHTLALLDILHYRQQIHSLGQYGHPAEEPTLRWGDLAAGNQAQKSRFPE
ncbi:MAG: ion transporter [Planctomycetaceae bacterium]